MIPVLLLQRSQNSCSRPILISHIKPTVIALSPTNLLIVVEHRLQSIPVTISQADSILTDPQKSIVVVELVVLQLLYALLLHLRIYGCWHCEIALIVEHVLLYNRQILDLARLLLGTHRATVLMLLVAVAVYIEASTFCCSRFRCAYPLCAVRSQPFYHTVKLSDELLALLGLGYVSAAGELLALSLIPAVVGLPLFLTADCRAYRAYPLLQQRILSLQLLFRLRPAAGDPPFGSQCFILFPLFVNIEWLDMGDIATGLANPDAPQLPEYDGVIQQPFVLPIFLSFSQHMAVALLSDRPLWLVIEHYGGLDLEHVAVMGSHVLQIQELLGSCRHFIHLYIFEWAGLLFFAHSFIMTSSERLEHEVTGNASSGVLLVFLQGWPDQMDMWEHYMDASGTFGKYRLLKINMPNAGNERIAWGQDFELLSERIKTTIDSVEGVSRRILVSHDWGCIYGYVLDHRHPKYFEQIIAMDVPAYTTLTLKGAIYTLIYQMTLIIGFLAARLLKQSIGDAITRFVAKFFGYNPPYQISADRNYPYFYFWKNLLTSLVWKEKKLLKGYIPSVPVVYMYGTKKPFLFHGPKWETWLRETDGCEFHPVASNHWFMIKFKEFVADTIKRRVQG